MWEVVDGVCYELLVTTYSGLYRYNLQDIVRIQGFTRSRKPTTHHTQSWPNRCNIFRSSNQTAFFIIQLLQPIRSLRICHLV